MAFTSPLEKVKRFLTPKSIATTLPLFLILPTTEFLKVILANYLPVTNETVTETILSVIFLFKPLYLTKPYLASFILLFLILTFSLLFIILNGL